MNYIPVKNLNVPNGGPQPSAPPVKSDTPIYSSYTGNLVHVGPVPWGTPNDAPSTDSNHGGKNHVIEFNPANNSYMMHRQTGRHK